MSEKYTAKERGVMSLLSAAWNGFSELDPVHPMDKQEFCDAIHRAQCILMSRVAVRCNPDMHPPILAEAADIAEGKG